MLYLTGLLLLIASATAIPSNFYKVPLLDDTFKLVSDKEIAAILKEEEITPRYDAYKDNVFHLYTQSNPKVSQIIQIDDVASLRASNFNSALPTVFLVHGWAWDHMLFFVQESKDEYLKKGAYNVIAVDWSKGGGTSNYILARSRVGPSGVVIGRFIDFLVREAGVNVKNLIVSGFSLGGHVVGNTGKHLNGKLPVIFSLDPAGPLFFMSDKDRVDASDAEYVEVIHSNTASNGFTSPLGDVDFYPNGGGRQPGCGTDESCSHNRAPRFFIESINGNVKFVGTRCSTFESVGSNGCDFVAGATKVMGGEPHTRGSGVFYLATNSNSPYARG